MGSNEDLRAARRMLGDLPKFDDDGVPIRESEWRHSFMIYTRDITNTQRAQLWADKLVYDGVAYEWLEAHKAKGPAEAAQTLDWSTLEPLIESRWATPKRDQAATAARRREQWRNSRFDIEPMLPLLRDDNYTTRPHEAWARRHYAFGKATTLPEDELLFQSLEGPVLPKWLLNLIPNHPTFTTLEQLCDAIGAIAPRRLLDAYDAHEHMASLTATVAALSLSVGPRPALRSSTPSTAPVRVPTPARTLVPAAQANTRPAQVTFAPQAPSREPRTRQLPPHMTQGPASTPGTTGRRDPIPGLVAEDTAEERARYQAEVKAWKDAHGEFTKPTKDLPPFPLSPGTLHQTRDVCINCARGLHPLMACSSQLQVPQQERTARGVLLGLMRDIRRRDRNGPGNPDPLPVQQLECQSDDHDESSGSEN